MLLAEIPKESVAEVPCKSRLYHFLERTVKFFFQCVFELFGVVFVKVIGFLKIAAAKLRYTVVLIADAYTRVAFLPKNRLCPRA